MDSTVVFGITSLLIKHGTFRLSVKARLMSTNDSGLPRVSTAHEYLK